MTLTDPCAALEREAGRLEAAGEREAAIALLERELSPGCFNARLLYARLLYLSGRTREAVDAVRAAERQDPYAPQFRAVQEAVQARDFAAARSRAEAMLAASPAHPRAVFALAHLAQIRGDFEAAAETLEDGLAACPANPALQSMLIAALEQSGRYAAALDAARTLVDLEESAEALWMLITVALRYGANELALETCARAAPLCVQSPQQTAGLHHVRGQCLRILGRTTDAIGAFRESLEADPDQGAAWWGLADMKTYRFNDVDSVAITRLAEHYNLPAHERSLATFSLARARAQTGARDEAMALFAKANALRPGAGFDPAAFEAATERVIAGFSPDALRVKADPPPAGPAPVFIVGLPRSGSTLVEQILARHPQIEGTIEQPTLPAVKRRAHLLCNERFKVGYLDGIARLTPSDLAILGQAYLDNGALFRSESAPVFTDKLPGNFEHVGLIDKILPGAVIIDVRRNPLDCGLSLYTHHFAQGVEFSYRLSDIAAYYNGYLKIMDHWASVLPGRVHTVQYEDLIAEPEPVIRALVDHAGVAFDPACLTPHESRRPVRTASSEQVRQPINRQGVGAWKSVAPHLAPLKEALGETTLKRFARYL